MPALMRVRSVSCREKRYQLHDALRGLRDLRAPRDLRVHREPPHDAFACHWAI